MSIELQAEIDDLTEKLSEYRQTIDDHNNELIGREEIGYDNAMLEMEGKIQHAFIGGFDCGLVATSGREKLKALLNYNMEQRL